MRRRRMSARSSTRHCCPGQPDPALARIKAYVRVAEVRPDSLRLLPIPPLFSTLYQRISGGYGPVASRRRFVHVRSRSTSSRPTRSAAMSCLTKPPPATSARVTPPPLSSDRRISADAARAIAFHASAVAWSWRRADRLARCRASGRAALPYFAIMSLAPERIFACRAICSGTGQAISRSRRRTPERLPTVNETERD
jgi:hypothetical protein